ncbi:MAG: alpha/beta hydrolase [Eggerthellaceae bacterium]|nr:alpha/beta hydrolase [Eggerthellaceae bacterium]
MEHKQYPTPSGAVHYWVDRTAGEQAPWLVLLPGLTADHSTFEPQFSFFSGRANLLSWDAPAHGLSRPFALDFSIDDMARMLHDIFEAERIAAPVFAGQSLGGYIAQAYIDLFPGSAGGFISIDSAPLKRVYYPNWEVALLRHTLGIYLCVPWALLKPWGAHGAARSEEGRAQMRRFIDSYHKREYCELVAHCYAKLADAIDERRPYEIDCPALLLCGEKDSLGDVKPFNRKWTEGDGIPLVWVPGAGHISNADNPDFVNAQIEGFIGLV